MQKVTILVGVIGSGKSTYAKMLADKDPQTVIVEGDAIRTMLKARYSFCENVEKILKDTVMSAIISAINHGMHVVDDAIMCIKSSQRTNMIHLIQSEFDKSLHFEIVEFVFGPECLERRLKDNRGYPNERWIEVYNDMVRIFEKVSSSEGFHSYRYINNLQEGGTSSAG